MKLVKSLKESGLLIKCVSTTNENETEEQKGGSFVMLLGTVATSLLGNVLKGKGDN